MDVEIKEFKHSEVTREAYKFTHRCAAKDSRGLYHEGLGNSRAEAERNARNAFHDFYDNH